MQQYGFYIIKEQFFIDFPDPYLKGNKSEGRPNYYALKDNKTGLYWMIPLSSRIPKYQALIQKRQENNQPCDIFHITTLDNKKQAAFLIGDMFPITDDYILRPYTVGQNPLVLTRETERKTIDRKARKVFALLHKGIKFSKTPPDVLKIEKQLLEG